MTSTDPHHTSTTFEWEEGPLDDPFASVPEPDPEPPPPPFDFTTEPLGTDTGRAPSEGYREVEMLREGAYGINWEPLVSSPQAISRSELSAEQWSVIEALYELRLLTGGQLQREFLGAVGERQARRWLARLREAGAVRRGSFWCANRRGRGKTVYVLEEQGFALLRDDPDHPASGHWQRPSVNHPQLAVHDLVRNEWLFAFQSLAPRQLLRWRGTKSGWIRVPTVWEPGAAGRRLKWTDLIGRAPRGLLRDEFSNMVPDLTLELRLDRPGEEEIRADLLVEIEWRNNNKDVRKKAIAYDALLNGWWQEHPRYKALGRPPAVVFVVPDLARAHRFLAIFDKALQGHYVIPPKTQTKAENEQGIVPKAKKVYLGRLNIYVAVNCDVHQRTLRAWRVPVTPPHERDDDEAAVVPRRSPLLGIRDLEDSAT